MSKKFRKIRGGAGPPPLPGGNPANAAGATTPPANTTTPVAANTPAGNSVAPAPPAAANTGVAQAPPGPVLTTGSLSLVCTVTPFISLYVAIINSL